MFQQQNNHNTNTKKSLLDWLSYMQGIHVSAIDMGLSRVIPVAEKLHLMNAAKQSFVFTVAGTNGKGSTTAVIAEICKQAGYKTALYQSPHLLAFNERVQINGTPVDDECLIDAFEKVEKARLSCELSLSFFEMTTLAAMLIFSENDCDVWVLEIGLGGRLDVVNIIDADVAVITNIGIDHVDWLGNNREKIGFEKAGILRQNIPLIFGHSDIPMSVKNIVDELNVTCYQIGHDFYYSQQDMTHSMSLTWQYSNASLTMSLPLTSLSLLNTANAISAVLASSLNISQKHISNAMSVVKLAGRFDYRELQSRRWLFDVGHNEHGMSYFLEQLSANLPSLLNDNGRLIIVFSMLKDKDIKMVVSMLHDFPTLINHWYIAPIDPTYIPRSANIEQLTEAVSTHISIDDISCLNCLQDATNLVVKESHPDDLILVCGSFHTISEVLQSLTS